MTPAAPPTRTEDPMSTDLPTAITDAISDFGDATADIVREAEMGTMSDMPSRHRHGEVGARSSGVHHRHRHRGGPGGGAGGHLT